MKVRNQPTLRRMKIYYYWTLIFADHRATDFTLSKTFETAQWKCCAAFSQIFVMKSDARAIKQCHISLPEDRITSIKHCAPRISSTMATIDEFALKNIGLWWRYGISRHCDEWKYINCAVKMLRRFFANFCHEIGCESDQTYIFRFVKYLSTFFYTYLPVNIHFHLIIITNVWILHIGRRQTKQKNIKQTKQKRFPPPIKLTSMI
jgi:hypothetical protein